MRFDDHILITDPTLTDDGGGGKVEGTPLTIYDGPCNAQDQGSAFDVDQGRVVSRGAADVYLPSPTDAPGKRPGMDALLTWKDGARQAGKLVTVGRLDGGLVVRYSAVEVPA